MSDIFNIQGGFNPTGAAIKIARYFGMQNIKIVSKKDNPYLGQPELNVPYEKDAPLGLSILGTPIYTDLTLLGCQYVDNLTGKTVILPDDRSSTVQQWSVGEAPKGYYMNLVSIIITIDQPIRVIKTEIQGRDGTVKEYIGKDDAKITVNGVISGLNGVYPRDEVNRLKRWFDAPVSKGITAWWLDNLGISNIVVESYNFPQVEGGYSYQMFSFSAISDNPVELKITQPNV